MRLSSTVSPVQTGIYSLRGVMYILYDWGGWGGGGEGFRLEKLFLSLDTYKST